MNHIGTISIDLWPVAAVLVFIGCDILTGWLKAYATTGFSSKVMRMGLLHKVTYLIIIVVFIAVEALQKHFSFWPDFPTTGTICTYICITELISIFENVAQVNPEVQSWPIISSILKKGEINDDDTRGAEE